MIKLKNYSKVRILLAIPLWIFASVIFAKTWGNFSQIYYFYAVILYFIGTILFVLNRKLADYISFAIFAFSSSAVFTFWVNTRFPTVFNEELFYFVITLVASIFLLTNVFRKK